MPTSASSDATANAPHDAPSVLLDHTTNKINTNPNTRGTLPAPERTPT